MPLAVLDWTANHVRAWATHTDGVPPRQMRLEGDSNELPLVLFLERKHVRVGSIGLTHCRQLPHQVCQGFLPLLGETRQWHYKRNRFTAEQALGLIAAQAREKFTGTKKTLLTVPAYLSPAQCNLLRQLVQDAGLKVLGLLRRSLTLSVASHWEHPWLNHGILVDVDDHALCLTVLRPDPVAMHLVRQQSLPHLGLKHWRERLLQAVGDLCIRQHRRDPRTIAEADQLLFDQSDRLLDSISQGHEVSVNVQVGHWVQQITLSAGQGVQECTVLAVQAAQATLAGLTSTVRSAQAQATVYLTPQAARLPGLAAAVYAQSQSQVPVVLLRSAAEEAALVFAERIEQGKMPPCDGQTQSVPLAHPTSDSLPATLPFPATYRQVTG